MKEKRDHIVVSTGAFPSAALHLWQMACHRPQVSTCPSQSQIFFFLSCFLSSSSLCLCSSISAPCFCFCPPLSSLTFLHSVPDPKPCKTFHTWTTRPHVACNVKSTFPWRRSNVSLAFPQPLFNPWLASWGPSAWPLITPCALLWPTSAV